MEELEKVILKAIDDCTPKDDIHYDMVTFIAKAVRVHLKDRGYIRPLPPFDDSKERCNICDRFIHSSDCTY